MLGLIPDSHRAYLNGHFVGGADQGTDLAIYSFDPKLLDHDANTLLIAAESRPTLNPGLTLLPGVGAFVGEFSEAKRVVVKNQNSFTLLRSVYFAVSVLIFLFAFSHAVFRRASRLDFYFAFILLLGSLQLAYYSPWVNAAFGFECVRLLKVLGLTLMPFILQSAYFTFRKNKRLEFGNNLASVIYALLATTLLLTSPNGGTFIARFNGILFAAIVYVVVAMIFQTKDLALKEITSRRQARPHHAGQLRSDLSISVFYLAFALLSWSGLVAALKRGLTTEFIPTWLHASMVNLSLATPFLFAIAILLLNTVDYIRKSHASKIQTARAELALEVTRITHRAVSPVAAVEDLHKKLCAHIGASRSTLYTFDQAKPEELRPLQVLAPSNGLGALVGPMSASSGIFGYVCQHRVPLIVNDVRRDVRFSEAYAKPSGDPERHYRTGSCIVVPLLMADQVIGVLSFADKAEDRVFDETDLNVVLELSSTMGLLLHSLSSSRKHSA